MTSLLVWAALDSRGPTSIYVAADSRISWDDGGWNAGRKIFAAKTQPHLFGYCGDVTFPALVLAQAADLVDSGALARLGPDQQARAVFETARRAFSGYPNGRKKAFEFIHCIRAGTNMAATFHVYSTTWNPNTWVHKILGLPVQSDIVQACGSGAESVERWKARWDSSSQARTSRAAFSAFCDSLAAKDDPFSGGAPQLAALHRSMAKQYGIIWKGERYFAGVPVPEDADLESLEWRNAAFEICDGKTGERTESSKKHFAPRGLGGNVRPRRPHR